MTPANWQSYLDSISALGYTAVHNQGPLPISLDPTDDNGNAYFNATVSAGVYNITQPNSAAFANIRSALLYANGKGLVSIFFPAYGGFAGASPVEGILDALQAATGAQVEAYGNYVGSLINDIPGVIIALGGDLIPGSTDLEKYRRLTVGIKATDRSGRIYTWHAARGQSSYDVDTVTAGYVAALGVPFIDWAYARETGSPLAFVHNQVLNSYAAPHTVFLGEAFYENSSQANGDALMLRRQFWGAWLSGACGSSFGDINRYLFESGWQSTLSRTGLSHDVIGIGFIRVREWWKLVPSTGTGLVTSGGGTVNTSGYKPRAVTSDGKLALVHVTDGSSTTIDKSKLSGPFTARWFDPTSGNYTAIGTGIANSGTQAYTTPGTNSAGAVDWVWVGEVP